MKGYHIMLDIFGVDGRMLDDPDFLMQLMKKACEGAGMKVIKGEFHKFNPQGVTAFYILAESHISIHTWPEKGSAALDIYYCGEREAVEKVSEILVSSLSPKKIRKNMIERK